MTLHTCINTATTCDARIIPSCAACREQWEKENPLMAVTTFTTLRPSWICERCKQNVTGLGEGCGTHRCV